METKLILQNDPLWKRLQNFSLDHSNADFPFSKKLTKEENWPSSFTDKAIEEYKKFVYLCCTLPDGASPSEIVDKVCNINQGNYLGGYIRSTGGGRPNVRYGFIFDKPNYSIGKYANNGIRGFSGGNSLNASFSNNNLTILRSGLWTSAMNLNSAIGAYFNVEGGLLGTERLFLFTPSYLFRPQAAMSCRCAKIQYDANGNEIGRYDPNAIPVPLNSGKQATTIFAEKEIEQKVKSNDLVLYPNPVSSVLYINANDDKEYYYQIYNMSGQLVKKGKFENKQTNVSELISGVYLVRVNDAEKVVKIIKN